MEFKYEPNRIYLEDAECRLLAEITFPPVSNDTVNIDHTFVDSSMRNQGIADQLMCAVCDLLKKENKKAVATCSYARSWFEKHSDDTSVLVKYS